MVRLEEPGPGPSFHPVQRDLFLSPLLVAVSLWVSVKILTVTDPQLTFFFLLIKCRIKNADVVCGDGARDWGVTHLKQLTLNRKNDRNFRDKDVVLFMLIFISPYSLVSSLFLSRWRWVFFPS